MEINLRKRNECWSTLEIESSGQNIKFKIKEDDVPISNRHYLQILSDSKEFRTFYNAYLADSGFEAFFWENKPMSNRNLDDDYECNIINTNFLAARFPDNQTFSKYFEENKNVVTFPNLAKDAKLIVPCPKNEHSDYTHIGNFVRKAGNDQIDDLWKITGRETMKSISSKPTWLSTSGLGVYWLHIRVDTIPKYYQTQEYKNL